MAIYHLKAARLLSVCICLQFTPMSLYVVSVCYFSVAVSTVTYGVCFLRDKGVVCRAHAGKKNSLVFLL